MNENVENEAQVELPMTPQAACACAPQPAPRTRRVGTFTMGLALIITGVVLCIGLFNPKFDFVTVFKLSPLILVALGVEILIAFTFGKGERFKYDFLSMFVCFCLIAASAGASCMPFFLDNFGPARENAQNALSAQWYDAIYEKLKGNTQIKQVTTDIYFGDFQTIDDAKTIETLNTEDYAHAFVMLDGIYADEAAFLKACEPVIAAVKASGVSDPDLQICTPEKAEREKIYSLSLNGRYAFEKSIEQLAENVSVQIYDTTDKAFYDADDYAQIQQNRAEQAAAENAAAQQTA